MSQKLSRDRGTFKTVLWTCHPAERLRVQHCGLIHEAEGPGVQPVSRSLWVFSREHGRQTTAPDRPGDPDIRARAVCVGLREGCGDPGSGPGAAPHSSGTRKVPESRQDVPVLYVPSWSCSLRAWVRLPPAPGHACERADQGPGGDDGQTHLPLDPDPAVRRLDHAHVVPSVTWKHGTRT